MTHTPSAPTKSTSLWRRLRNMMRLRVSGELDIRHMIASADLPESCRQLIWQVVSQSRLWRSEKVDVAGELITHFQSGLDDGQPVESLVKDFGDPRQTALLIRRAKKRNRSYLWQTYRYASWAMACFVGVYAMAMLWLITQQPSPSVDYVKIINAPAQAVPQKERAWTLYRQVILDHREAFEELKNNDGLLWVRSPTNRNIRFIRPGDPRWPQAARWLKANHLLLEQIHAASQKPHMGLVLATEESGFDPTDLPALFPGYAAPIMAQNAKQKQATKPVYGMLLPQIGILSHHMANLVVADSQLAIIEHDTRRLLRNLHTLLGLARHVREPAVLISQLVTLRIANYHLQLAGEMLHQHGRTLSPDELDALSTMFTGMDDLFLLDLTMEKRTFLDLLQHIYSPQGHMTMAGLKLMASLSDSQSTPAADYVDEKTMRALSLPIKNLVLVSQEEMQHEFDRIIDAYSSQTTIAPWLRRIDGPMKIAVTMNSEGEQWRQRYRLILLMMTLPSFDGPDTASSTRDALQMVIAMEKFRHAQGRYPSQPQELVPTYLTQLPPDPQTGEPMLVKYQDDGSFSIYGRGKNKQDDHGQVTQPVHPQNLPPEQGDQLFYPPHRVAAKHATTQQALPLE